MHCSEEYLVVYSAHSVGKPSERKDGCFHILHLFCEFSYSFFLFVFVFSVFYLPTNMACIISLIYFFFQLDTSACLCCIFLCHSDPNIVIYSMFFDFQDSLTLLVF